MPFSQRPIESQLSSRLGRLGPKLKYSNMFMTTALGPKECREILQEYKVAIVVAVDNRGWQGLTVGEGKLLFDYQCIICAQVL